MRSLGGFRKAHHTVPDAANPTTQAFLGKLCQGELAAEAERLFQDVRCGLNYRRKDISLSVTSPSATLTARDFTVEILYALEPAEPSRYAVTTTLHGLHSAVLARSEPFARIFAGRFSEIAFGLKRGARVEDVIDAIEGLDGEAGLTVDYPSDYRDCTVAVATVDAQVRCTGGAIELVFPRAGAPAELMEAFAEVRGAFQISKALAALLA